MPLVVPLRFKWALLETAGIATALVQSSSLSLLQSLVLSIQLLVSISFLDFRSRGAFLASRASHPGGRRTDGAVRRRRIPRGDLQKVVVANSAQQ